jgi:hypothetical protein
LYLMFLRADCFRAHDAASRMMKHFDCKKDFFGEEKLCRDITLEDFNKHDLKCFENGSFQIAPTRDRAGRAVICNVMYKQQYHERINVVGDMWRAIMLATILSLTNKQPLLYHNI